MLIDCIRVGGKANLFVAGSLYFLRSCIFPVYRETSPLLDLLKMPKMFGMMSELRASSTRVGCMCLS